MADHTDILPLYIVLLMWFPILLWLLRLHVGLAFAASVSLWLAANLLGLEPAGRPSSASTLWALPCWALPDGHWPR
jgi:hypothetical protein